MASLDSDSLSDALGGGDQHQHALGAREVDALQQRAGHGLLGGDAGAVRAGGHGGAHHGLAGLAHHGAHVLEVDVHVAGHVDDLGDAADGVLQHVVGVGEGLVLRDVVAQHFEQLLVEHHDQRIDVGFELGQALVGVGHAAAAFPVEGLGDHAHGQDAHFLGHARDHRRRAGAGAAAHAGGDEQHVGARRWRRGCRPPPASAASRPFSGLLPAPRPLLPELDDLVRARCASAPAHRCWRR